MCSHTLFVFVFTGNSTICSDKIAEAKLICLPSSIYSGFPTNNKDYTQQCNQALSFCGIPIMAHRPHNGPHIGLYYEGFGSFMSKCDRVIPSRADCFVAVNLCSVMAKYYESESARVAAFKEVLDRYIELQSYLEHPVLSCKCDYVISKRCILLLKAKVEGNCDSLSELIRYYIASMESRNYTLCPSPAFLLELVGPHLFISGAVFGEGVYVDRLTSALWLVPQYQSPEHQLHIARVLRALKEEMIALDRYYENSTTSRFPMFQQFDNKQINYSKQISPKPVWGGEEVLIKFAHTYSDDIHKYLEQLAYAPKLHHFERNNCYGESYWGMFRCLFD